MVHSTVNQHPVVVHVNYNLYNSCIVRFKFFFCICPGLVMDVADEELVDTTCTVHSQDMFNCEGKAGDSHIVRAAANCTVSVTDKVHIRFSISPSSSKKYGELG